MCKTNKREREVPPLLPRRLDEILKKVAHTPQSSNCAPYAVNTSLNSWCHISYLIKEVYVVLNHNSLFMINQKSAKLIINKFIYTNDSFILYFKLFQWIICCNLDLNQILMVNKFSLFKYSFVWSAVRHVLSRNIEQVSFWIRISNTYVFWFYSL